MRLFTLIYGDELHLTSKKKVIPSQEFSSCLDAKELLEKTTKEAQTYHKKVVEEAEVLKEQAELAGFNTGLEQWAMQLAHYEVELKKAKADLEESIVPVAIRAAKKIVGREIELDPTVVVDIVKQALRSVSQHHRFVIYVNKADFATLDNNRPRLKEGLEGLQSLTVKERDGIAPGDCVIETEAGIINVRREQLWETLETTFKTLMKSS